MIEMRRMPVIEGHAAKVSHVDEIDMLNRFRATVRPLCSPEVGSSGVILSAGSFQQ